MATPQACLKCGSPNPVGANFCQNCGIQLTVTQPTPTLPPQPQPRPAAPGPSITSPIDWSRNFTFQQMAYARSEQVDRTKTGLLLLITGAVIGQIGVIASVLGHIPLIGALGGIVAIIGAVLIILGRKPFGPQHSTYVWLSVGLYVLGFIITLVAATVFALEVLQNVRTGLSTPALIDAFSANFNDFLVGAFIAGAVIGIAQVLLTYALQKPAGRILLWSAYVIGLAIGIYVLSVIGAQITSAVQSAFSGGNFNRAAIDDLTTQASNLGLLSIITTIMYVVAYYLAWSRINNEEIPEPLKPPSTLTGPLP